MIPQSLTDVELPRIGILKPSHPIYQFPSENFQIPGCMIGSSHRLLEECKHLAEALELPLDMNQDSEPSEGAQREVRIDPWWSMKHHDDPPEVRANRPNEIRR